MTTAIPAAEVTLPIAAPPAEVFAYLTDAARYVRWMGATAALDARPGGRYEVAMRDGFHAAGSYAEVDAPHRVVFTWGFADDEAATHTKHAPGQAPAENPLPTGSTRVTVTLEPDGDGTRLTLRHDNLPSTDLAAAHQVAWETYLSRLAIAAAGGDPGPDPHD